MQRESLHDSRLFIFLYMYLYMDDSRICKFPGCDTRLFCTYYCMFHRCFAINCKNPKIIYKQSNYCDIHTCRIDDCTQTTHNDTIYCEQHLEIISNRKSDSLLFPKIHISLNKNKSSGSLLEKPKLLTPYPSSGLSRETFFKKI